MLPLFCPDPLMDKAIQEIFPGRFRRISHPTDFKPGPFPLFFHESFPPFPRPENSAFQDYAAWRQAVGKVAIPQPPFQILTGFRKYCRYLTQNPHFPLVVRGKRGVFRLLLGYKEFEDRYREVAGEEEPVVLEKFLTGGDRFAVDLYCHGGEARNLTIFRSREEPLNHWIRPRALSIPSGLTGEVRQRLLKRVKSLFPILSPLEGFIRLKFALLGEEFIALSFSRNFVRPELWGPGGLFSTSAIDIVAMFGQKGYFKESPEPLHFFFHHLSRDGVEPLPTPLSKVSLPGRNAVAVVGVVGQKWENALAAQKRILAPVGEFFFSWPGG